MSDVIPQEHNRAAVLIGRILHPFLLPIPTTLAILSDLPLLEALAWTAVIIGITVVPGIVYVLILRRRGRHLYQRQTRKPLYLFGWLCVVVAFVVVIVFNAPRVLIASTGALVVWMPLQGAMNTWVTKVSGHAAVAVGCYMGLLVLGKLETVFIQVILLLLVVLTLWARVETRNHTVRQVLLGVLAGSLPVLLVFPLVMR